MAPSPSFAAGATLLLICAAACGTERFVRVEDIPEPKVSSTAEYRIALGDVLSVNVWNQDAMSVGRAPVREDGKISMPFLQDIEVVGQTPAELASRLQVKLKPFVVSPVVTVAVVERRPVRVSVLGEVARPGLYDVDHGAGVLVAIAAAGGLTTYAHRDRVFVLRKGFSADGRVDPVRIRFRYDSLVQGERPAATFRLQSGDVLSVE